MRIIRYQTPEGLVQYGHERADGTCFEISGDVFGRFEPTDRPARIERRLAPISPRQIICIGLNYRRHAEETNARIPEYPVMFAKGVSSLQNPGAPIEIPTHLPSHEVDYECELAVVIGRDAKNVSPADASKYVLGYTAANDVSARDWQIAKGGGQWCRGKYFDTFCPLGPALVTADEIPDPHALRISTTLSGQLVQDWTTGDMIFRIPELISFLSGSCTLPAGTVILTGTPHGVGMAAKPPRWLRPGDIVTIEIERIGKLTNPVIAEK